MKLGKMYFICFIILHFFGYLWTLDTQDIVIVISSQASDYNLKLAETRKHSIVEQANVLKVEEPLLYISSLDLTHVGDWTIIPLIPNLSTSNYTKSKLWYIFIEPRTTVRLDRLIDILNKYDHNEEMWMGHAIYDRDATIIHHFAFYEDPSSFVYPCIASGFAVSNALMQRLAERLSEMGPPTIDFNIDSSHEFSLFVWNKGEGKILTNEPSFCTNEQSLCATFVTPVQNCGQPISKESIYFAVKTCSKFHNDRVPILKKTWAPHVKHIAFFSNEEDKDIPTVNLGIPNTENGHCAKTIGIMKYVSEQIVNLPDINWISIVDDDTILSVARLRQLLSCYDASSPVLIGERYGYNLYHHHGYNYITGGGGMVFSVSLLKQLAANCECPMLDSPDDMIIGMCMVNLGLTVTHSPQFHQARPNDYPPELLEISAPVSFHKHWMIDPLSVYEEWFAQADLDLEKVSSGHNEL